MQTGRGLRESSEVSADIGAGGVGGGVERGGAADLAGDCKGMNF